MSQQPAREQSVGLLKGNATKVVRRREKTSAVWEYFKECSSTSAQCKKCDFKTPSIPTTNMWRHLQNSHTSV
jgi:hypothetical protein